MTSNIEKISFVMYCILFISAVLTFKAGKVKFQISQYMWSIVTVCIVVFQCKLLAKSILNGIFWFLFPIGTVVSTYMYIVVCICICVYLCLYLYICLYTGNE